MEPFQMHPDAEFVMHDIYEMDLEQRSEDRDPTIWRNSLCYQNPRDSKVFTIVYELPPSRTRVRYKANGKFMGGKIHEQYLNLPWQIYCQTFIVKRNVNTNTYNFIDCGPELAFSPTSWADTSVEGQWLYRPWLPNILATGTLVRFCQNEDRLSRPMNENIDENAFKDPGFTEKLIKYHDSFYEQPFNADAGGLRFKDFKECGPNAIVTPFRRIQRLSFDDVLDPNSEWYQNAAFRVGETVLGMCTLNRSKIHLKAEFEKASK